MPKSNVGTSDKQVQTTIHCQPHILVGENDLATVTCDRGIQTVASSAPDTKDSNFYTLLEFIPYQVIVEDSIKELDLPRRAFLQWKLPNNSGQEETTSTSTDRSSERQESEIFRQKSVLKKATDSESAAQLQLGRIHLYHAYIMQKDYTDQDTQTVVTVSPHVLEADEVANVYTELSTQTSITCVPDSSISNILPELKANLPHSEVSLTQTDSQIVSTGSVQPSNSYIEIQVYSSTEDHESHVEADQSLIEDVESSEKLPNPAQAVSVTLPPKIKKGPGCQCHAQMLNKIANKMRVHASTLKLTPREFPATTKFEERMMEVLNTTIAILQTEMARLMDMYIEEDDDTPPPTPGSPVPLLTQNSKPTDDSNVLTSQTIQNDPTSNDSEEITTEPGFVKEDVMEESISETARKFLENGSTNDFFEENREPFMSEVAQKLLVSEPCVCICRTTSESVPEDTEEFTLTDENKSMLEETTPPTDGTNEKSLLEETETVEDNALGETIEELADDTSETRVDKIASKAELSIPPTEIQITLEIAPTENNTLESTSGLTSHHVAPLPIELGDHKNVKRLSFIPCECHPSEAGAAPPTLSLHGSNFSSNLPSTDAMPSSTIKTIDRAPSVEIRNIVSPSSEKANKFELLMKNSIKDVESVSATSAIVIRAVISSPDASKKNKENVNSRSSLPDLRDQVIRLSVIYKNGTTEPEIKIEELLTPGCCPIQTTANKSPSSRINTKTSNVSPSILNSKQSLATQNVTATSSCAQRSVSNPRVDVNTSYSQSIDAYSNKLVGAKKWASNTMCECGKLYCQRKSFKKSSNTSSTVSSRNPNIKQKSSTDSTVCECGRLACSRRPNLMPSAPCFRRTSSKLSPVTFQTNYVPKKSCLCFDKKMQTLSQQLDYNLMPHCSCSKNSYARTPSCSSSSQIQASSHPSPPPLLSYHQHIKNPNTCVCFVPPPPEPVYTYPNRIEENEEELEITPGITFDDSEDNTTNTLSLTYEDNAIYEEPYMTTIDEDDTSTAVQTDLVLGDKLQSESLSSLYKEEVEESSAECTSKTEMPWGKISLSHPGSYNIKSVQKNKDESDGKSEFKRTEEDVDRTEVEDEPSNSTSDGADNEHKKELPPPAEPGPLSSKPRRQQDKLVFEDLVNKYNEPYMEGLYKDFPNSDEENGDCDSSTEMPWKDIILPENCKIKKMKKTTKCICRSNVQTLSGMFLPTNDSTPIKQFEESNEGDLIQIHTGLEEPLSSVFPIQQRITELDSNVSVYSNIAQIPKRCHKEHVLSIDKGSNNYNVSFKTGRRHSQVTMDPVPSSSSLPFEVTTKQVTEENTSSFIVSIKPSTEPSYHCQKMPISKTSAKVNPDSCSIYLGSVGPTITSTTSRMNCDCKTGPCTYAVKKASSMPAISSQRNIKATVSLKRVGEQAKIITQQMPLSPGDNFMTVKIPDEPISLKLKVSAPSTQACDQAGPSMTKPLNVEPIFTPGRCGCTDNVKPDTFKEDPVMVALDAYEAEMKPLKRALTALQQKIRNLNMPEMKGCMCSTILRDPAPPDLDSAPNGISVLDADPGTDATAMYLKKQPRLIDYSYVAPGVCPHFQPASFRAPSKNLPYGYLPPPILPPYGQSYAQPPNYLLPRSGCQHTCDCNRRSTPHVSTYGGHRDLNPLQNKSSKKHIKGYVPSRGQPSPIDDLSKQARYYGMYPDYRGRTYPDEQVAYQDSYYDDELHNRSNKVYKIRHVISLRSVGDMSDYDGHDSDGASDVDDSYYRESRYPKSSNRSPGCKHDGSTKGFPSSSSGRSYNFDNCMPCKDSLDGRLLRSGQAVKTDPDEFLMPTCVISKKSQGISTSSPKVSKIRIKVPSR